MIPLSSGKLCTMRPAFSLAESLFCVLLVGGLLVAALYAVGDTTVARKFTGDRGVGQLLAQDLMTEIVRLPYKDPDQTPAYGTEPGEVTGNRSLFDDIDDFHNWSAAPPAYANGTAMSNLTGWTRTVKVERVANGQFNTPGDAGSETGIKRITVEILQDGKVAARLVALRTDGASAARPTKFDTDPEPPAPTAN